MSYNIYKKDTDTLDPIAGRVADVQAEQVHYSNAESGLTSTDVQGAIDEVFEETVNKIGVNYSNPIRITSEDSQAGSFIAPRNGIAYCNLHVTAGSSFITVSINSLEVGVSTTISSYIFPFLMRKGDTLTWSSSGAGAVMRANRSNFV